MAKVLFINPNKWGRGITHIWIASHSSILKRNGHHVELFDSTFYQEWTDNEVEFATSTGMFKKSNYNNEIIFNKKPILKDLQDKINSFNPDIIFWSAISSHIHSEGEYVNIQNGYNLVKNLDFGNATLITGGLQATSAPEHVLKNFNKINYLIRGESELVLLEVANSIDNKKSINSIDGLSYLTKDKIIKNKKQNILKNLDILIPYDYSIFDEQVFLRPYNGRVIKAVDFELSRGCIYSCSYCVETIIQKYYGFDDFSKKTGAIKNFKSYLRSKSAKNIFLEIKKLYVEKKIKLFRCQDTNFLTNDRKILNELSDLINSSGFDIFLYIETRPEGINENSLEILKKLKVDGVGMGIEMSEENFREEQLNRFASQSKTIDAFKLLKDNNIKRTSYNVIGFPNQSEESILKTIEFNRLLQPDNITVAFYSPYYGTGQQKEGVKTKMFDEYELSADAALRTKTKSSILSPERLNYYKKNFINLVRNEK